MSDSKMPKRKAGPELRYVDCADNYEINEIFRQKLEAKTMPTMPEGFRSAAKYSAMVRTLLTLLHNFVYFNSWFMFIL